jgi:hypothetical protein
VYLESNHTGKRNLHVFIWFFIYQLVISCVCMQSLCNLEHFRDKFLTEPLAWIPSADNICIAQQLYEIFISWEKNDYNLSDAVLTYMKTLLCRVDCTIFSEKVYTLITIVYVCTIILLMLVYHVKKADSVIRFGSDVTFKLFYIYVYMFSTVHRCGFVTLHGRKHSPSSYQN